MSGLTLGVQVIIGVIFLTSSGAKLIDIPRFKETIDSVGFIKNYSIHLARGIIILEGLSGILILTKEFVLIGIYIAIVMMCIFSVVVARVIVSGNRVDCFCFGSVTSSAITGKTLVRNVVIISILGLLLGLVRTRGSVDIGWIIGNSGESQATPILLIVVVAIGIVVVFTIRESLIEERLDRLEQILSIEDPFPSHLSKGTPVNQNLVGEDIMNRLGPAMESNIFHETILIFLAARCTPCHELIKTISPHMQSNPDRNFVILVADDTFGEIDCYDSYSNVQRVDILSEDLQRFGVSATPSAFAVDTDGRLSSSTAVGRPEIEELIRRSSKVVSLIQAQSAM